MFSGAKYCLYAGLPLACLFASCENDLKKIQEISAQEASKPVDRTINVEITYSDSARVKAVTTAPLLLTHTGKKPYYEMPNGVKIVFYENSKPVNTITANRGIRRDEEGITELHKNVVATNDKGDVFKSEELIWDENAKKIRSNQPVQITMSNGDIINGTSFESNQSFYPYTLKQSTGIFNVKENPMAE
ncbi:MAG: LPS export ABC transporter periplasmic protein LptC [Sphingobacteriaceae bacterium]|nr:MAG: LPS export ABC transporter periplasmic protein LptC [Sphingobacteriaceae bacterium]